MELPPDYEDRRSIIMDMTIAPRRTNWSSLLVDNILGLAFLIGTLFLTISISAIGLLGYVLFLSGVPVTLTMMPLSFLALLIPHRSQWRASWWFLTVAVAWVVSPIVGGVLFPWFNSLGDQPAVVSDLGSLVVWTQWLWTLPFIMVYLAIGHYRVRKSRPVPGSNVPAII